MTDAETGELCHCYTAPEQRDQGVSTRVKTDLIKAARKKGVKRLTALASLMHKPGLEKVGFTPLAQQPRGGKWNYTRMEMTL